MAISSLVCYKLFIHLNYYQSINLSSESGLFQMDYVDHHSYRSLILIFFSEYNYFMKNITLPLIDHMLINKGGFAILWIKWHHLFPWAMVPWNWFCLLLRFDCNQSLPYLCRISNQKGTSCLCSRQRSSQVFDGHSAHCVWLYVCLDCFSHRRNWQYWQCVSVRQLIQLYQQKYSWWKVCREWAQVLCVPPTCMGLCHRNR